MKKLRTLFLSTLLLSAFTFGGGYVIVTLMKKKFVDDLHWIEDEEMLNLIAIAQSAPGAIAVNGAIVLGYKIAGFLGVLVAILGTILPPFTIILVVSYFYALLKDNFIFQTTLTGMQAGVAAVIFAVVIDMAIPLFKQKSLLLNTVLVLAFIFAAIIKVNVMYIVLCCIGLGILYTLQQRRTSK